VSRTLKYDFYDFLSFIVETCMKGDKFRYLIPILEEVRGGVEPWLMARWKARIRLAIRHN